MSQVTVTLITPPVTFVCSGASATTMTVTMALTSVELAAALGQYDAGSSTTKDPEGS